MTHITEINCLDELAGYRLLWNSLLLQTRKATYFQTYEWLESYWRHFGHRQRLRVLIVSADEGPIGILPLAVQSERTRLGEVRVLTYPLDGWGSFYAPIGWNPTATLWAGMQHIHDTPRDWDLIDLRWIDADGIDAGRTRKSMQRADLAAAESRLFQAAQIQLDGDWDKYWRSRKQHWRENVNRSARKLAERGEVRYMRYRPEGARYGDGDPRWDLYDACERIARHSWQGAATNGTTLIHEWVRDYLRDAHEVAAQTGGVDLNLLLVDDEPAAFAYNYHWRGSVYGLRSGFDPAVSTDGSGSVLLRHAIEDSFERGDYLIDLGPNYLDVKRHWLTRVQTAYHCTHYATRLRPQALRMKRWLMGVKN